VDDSLKTSIEQYVRLLYLSTNYHNPESNGGWVCGSCAHGPDRVYPLGFTATPTGSKERINYTDVIDPNIVHDVKENLIEIDEHTRLRLVTTHFLEANSSYKGIAPKVAAHIPADKPDKKASPLYHGYFAGVAAAYANEEVIYQYTMTGHLKTKSEVYWEPIQKALDGKVILYVTRKVYGKQFNKFKEIHKPKSLFVSDAFTNRRYEYTNNNLVAELLQF
jgi:hypothetical protein